MVDQKINSLSRMYVCMRVTQGLCISFKISYPVSLILTRTDFVFHSFDFHRQFHFGLFSHHGQLHRIRRTGSLIIGPGFPSGWCTQGTGLRSVTSRGSIPPKAGRKSPSRNAASTGTARHGSGALYTIRSSSRNMDRAEWRTSRKETLQPNKAAVRVLPVERQRAADWASAVDIVVNRLVTVERTVRDATIWVVNS